MSSHLDAASIGQLDAGIVNVHCSFCKEQSIARRSKGIKYELVLKDVLESNRWIDDVDLLVQVFFSFLDPFSSVS